jgi:hypothetical protein
MPDDTGEQSSAAETQGDSVQTEVKSFVGEDGTFKEGWVDAYVPEDLRHLGDYRPITTVAQLAKEFGHAKTLIGRQGKGIMPLSKDAGPTEREAYYNALGRPKTPDDYTFDVPDDMKEMYGPDQVKDLLATMHGLGLTQEQVKGVMALDIQNAQKAIADRDSSRKTAYDAGLKVLKAEWGDAFDLKMQMANRVIEENVPADKKEEVLERWGNDLELTRVLSAIGETMLEDTMADAGGAGQGPQTPDELERQARELVSTPGYLDGRLSEATRERLRKEIHDLNEKARRAREKS